MANFPLHLTLEVPASLTVQLQIPASSIEVININGIPSVPFLTGTASPSACSGALNLPTINGSPIPPTIQGTINPDDIEGDIEC